MSDLKTCPGCKFPNEVEKENCKKCGYPFKASDEEQAKFIGQLILKKSTISEAKIKIKRARIALWIIGAYFIFSTLYMFTFMSYDLIPITYYLPLIFFGIIFVGFGFLTYRLPALSIIIPLVLLVSYWILNAILDTNSLLSGLFFKIAILMILGYALISVYHAQKIKKESNFLNSQ